MLCEIISSLSIEKVKFVFDQEKATKQLPKNWIYNLKKIFKWHESAVIARWSEGRIKHHQHSGLAIHKLLGNVFASCNICRADNTSLSRLINKANKAIEKSISKLSTPFKAFNKQLRQIKVQCISIILLMDTLTYWNALRHVLLDAILSDSIFCY